MVFVLEYFDNACVDAVTIHSANVVSFYSALAKSSVCIRNWWTISYVYVLFSQKHRL